MRPADDPSPEGIRLPWSRSDRPIPRRVLRPLQTFLETEVASGMLLLGAAALALAWANSPWRATYEEVWRTGLTLRLGGRAVSMDLRGWIDEGLMALFFLVVGLEIKRELLTGELRERRAAVLPIAAALGGMLVPALVYLAFTAGTPGARGWGIAMPTDIAFALGVLALAARGAPAGLRAFVLALAIVDDLGSILVVAVFYSGEVEWGWLVVAAALCIPIVALQRIQVRADLVYATLALALWLAFRAAGLSPTLAGVTAGFLTPAVAFQRPKAVSQAAHRIADETVDEPFPPDADSAQWLELAWLSREAVSPLARIESVLHPWTSFLVVPLFALANAGVSLSGGALVDAATDRVALGITAARVLGKVLGISLACFVAVRIGVARLPAGVGWRHVVGIAAAAGVPFTVSIFVAELALPSGALLDVAKVGIVAAAVVAGATGFALLRRAGAPLPARRSG